MEKRMYIDLLKKTLIDYHRLDRFEYKPFHISTSGNKVKFLHFVMRFLGITNLTFCAKVFFNFDSRVEGRDRPSNADTMIGLKRLNNIEECVNDIIRDNIPGDFIETGVWRGGATILMKGILKINNISDKVVWVADSFEGLPKPDGDKYEADKGDAHYMVEELAISLETVQNNFKKYDLLDENVRFLKGWFKDTLPDAPIEKIALLRLDGDIYQSTMDGLVNLYPKLSKGGFIIVDDWGAVKGCKQAVLDYRQQHGITEEMLEVDWTGMYWRKDC